MQVHIPGRMMLEDPDRPALLLGPVRLDPERQAAAPELLLDSAGPMAADEVPEPHADALIEITRRRDAADDRRRPEQCKGAADECFCASTWLSNIYWQWKAGGAYVPFSFREALREADALSATR